MFGGTGVVEIVPRVRCGFSSWKSIDEKEDVMQEVQ